MKEYLKIGDVAKLAGLSIDQVRLYDKLKIVTPSNRKKGHRYYTEGDAVKLRCAHKIKVLLCDSYIEVQEIMELRNASNDKESRERLKERLIKKQKDISEKIKGLYLIKKGITNLIQLLDKGKYVGEGSEYVGENCPIVKSFVSLNDIEEPYDIIETPGNT